jgi:hypothetical protein
VTKPTGATAESAGSVGAPMKLKTGVILRARESARSVLDSGASVRFGARIGFMSPRGDHVVLVSEIPSRRWELALEQLDAGGAMTVLDGDPPIGLQRYLGWPGADGHIHVSIFTALEPQSLTQEIASRDVGAGLRTLADAVAADPRLAELLERHGVIREYILDDGNGAVLVGDLDEQGSVRLR